MRLILNVVIVIPETVSYSGSSCPVNSSWVAASALALEWSVLSSVFCYINIERISILPA